MVHRVTSGFSLFAAETGLKNKGVRGDFCVNRILRVARRPPQLYILSSEPEGPATPKRIKIKRTLPLSLVCTALSWTRLEGVASTDASRGKPDPKLLGDEVSGMLANYSAGYYFNYPYLYMTNHSCRIERRCGTLEIDNDADLQVVEQCKLQEKLRSMVPYPSRRGDAWKPLRPGPIRIRVTAVRYGFSFITIDHVTEQYIPHQMCPDLNKKVEQVHFYSKPITSPRPPKAEAAVETLPQFGSHRAAARLKEIVTVFKNLGSSFFNTIEVEELGKDTS
ncbi:hypothetical protein B0H14DRAFT_2632145 [Mycena olivaceomarginata]|nr:hypothetical protein B0H14DRAFT_2632145 [Mycena olivaceomarginata]